MRINIAGGTGIMGKVHEPIFEKAGHEVILSGRNTNPRLEEAARISDVTIISVPIEATQEVIRKVAPYAEALMDFTGVKIEPLKWMSQIVELHGRKNCEITGLHPLYGDVKSISGRTIAYCPTNRTGEKSKLVIEALKKAGADIWETSDREHDLSMAVLQIGRVDMVSTFGKMVSGALSFEQAYRISPPQTREILDLLARQSDLKYDKTYEEMAKFNPFVKALRKLSIERLHEVLSNGHDGEYFREWFGDKLKDAQGRVGERINNQ